MVLGARAMLVDGDDRVLLLRHTYMPGWHFPGGGVEPGETAEDAARREAEEETGLRIEGPMIMLGLVPPEARGDQPRPRRRLRWPPVHRGEAVPAQWRESPRSAGSPSTRCRRGPIPARRAGVAELAAGGAGDFGALVKAIAAITLGGAAQARSFVHLCRESHASRQSSVTNLSYLIGS